MASGTTIGRGVLEIMPVADGMAKELNKIIKNAAPNVSLPLDKPVQLGLEDAFKTAGGALTSLGKGMQSVGGTLTSYITKPAIAAGVAVGGIFAGLGAKRLVQIDTAKAQLAGLGHSAETVEVVMGNALASVKGTSFGLGDAAMVAASAMASGVKEGQELERYLGAVADAAAIANIPMGDMGFIFNKVRSQGKAYRTELNMLAERGIPIFEWLAESGGMSMDELNEAIKNGEITAVEFEQAIEEHIGGAAKTIGELSVSAAFQNLGAAVGRVGEAFFSAGGDSVSALSLVKDAISGLIEQVDKLAAPAAEWGRVFAQVLSNSLPAIGRVKDAFIDLYQTVFPASDSVESLEDKISRLSASAETNINKVTNFVKDLKSTFEELSQPVQDAISEYGKFAPAVAIAFGPALVLGGKVVAIFGGIVSAVGGIIGAFGNVAPVAEALKVALFGVEGGAGGLLSKFKGFAGPIGIAIGLFVGMFSESENLRSSIGNLGGSLVQMVQNAAPGFGDLVGAVMDLVGAIGEALSPILETLGDLLAPIIDIIGVVLELVGDLAGIIAGVLAVAIREVLVPALEVVGNVLGPIIEALFGTLGDALSIAAEAIRGAWDSIKEKFDAAVEWLSNFEINWGEVFSAVSSFFSERADEIGTKFSELAGAAQESWDEISTAVGDAMSAASQWVDEKATAIKDTLTGAWDSAKTWTTTKWGEIKFAISSKLSETLSDVASKLGSIVGRITGAWENAKSSTREAFSTLVSTISGKLSEAVAWVAGLPGRIRSALGNVGNILVGAGRSIIDGFLRGLKQKFEAVKSFVSGIGGWIANNKGPKEYDLKLLRPAGRWIMSGLDSSLSESFQGVLSTVGSFAPAIENAFGNPSLDASSSYSASGAALNGGVTYNYYIDGVQISVGTPEEEAAFETLFGRKLNTARMGMGGAY